MTTTTCYLRIEDTGQRIDYVTEKEARSFARFLARYGARRLMVCRPSGRIVAAWDDGKRTV